MPFEKKVMVRGLVWIVVVAMTLVVSVYGIAWTQYERLLLHPIKTARLHPRLQHDSKCIWLPSGAMVWRSTTPLRKHVADLLFVHGNSGCIDDFASLVRDCLEPRGYRVYLLEYAGFGITTGPATPESLVINLKEAWESLPNPERTLLVGFSIGGGCIGQFLEHHLPQPDQLPAQVVIINSFYSLAHVGRDHVPLPLLEKVMARHEWKTSKGLKRYLSNTKQEHKVTLVFTEDDELIGPHHTEKLKQELSTFDARVVRVALPSGGHSSSVYRHNSRWIEELGELSKGTLSKGF